MLALSALAAAGCATLWVTSFWREFRFETIRGSDSKLDVSVKSLIAARGTLALSSSQVNYPQGMTITVEHPGLRFGFGPKPTTPFAATPGASQSGATLLGTGYLHTVATRSSARFEIRTLGIHLAIPTLLFAFFPLRALVHPLHRSTTHAQACPACGYDLRATPTQCPECGHRSSKILHPSSQPPCSSP